MRNVFITVIAIFFTALISGSRVQAAERSVTIDGITYFVNLDDESHSTAYVSASDENITDVNILSEVIIGNATYTVTKIGDSAFNTRIYLRNVKIPSTIKIIDSYAFNHSYLNNPIVIHEGLEEVGKYAYVYCEKNLVVPNSLKKYGPTGFAYYETVTIKNLSSFCSLEGDGKILIDDKKLFLSDQLLSEVTIPSDISKLNRAFAGCSSIVFVNTNRVTLIGSYAFEKCRNLKHVLIGLNTINEVSIKEGAFNGCERLEYIELGESVAAIDGLAFANLKSLDKVLCHSSIPTTVAKSAFNNSYLSWASLYVPVGARDAYKADPVWGQFGEIIEGFEGAGINAISEDDNTPIEYYDLNGIRIDEPKHGVYIRKQGSNVKKIVL